MPAQVVLASVKSGAAMKRGLISVGMLIGLVGAAQAQVDTSSYRQAPQPSMLDQISRIQQIELQRQQIEMGRMQLEQQRLQIKQADPEYRRQVEFERQQAENYRKRHPEARR
jgi:hypothetical protein